MNFVTREIAKTTIGATVKGGSSVNYKTGEWRESRPVFVSRMAPCREACPAGIDIQGFLWEAKHQRFSQAWKIIMEENPFPSICGRVCGHPCEEACNRNEFDEPLAIHSLERFVGDFGLENGIQMTTPKTNVRESIAVIGSGPAGLSCAYHLRRLGYRVKVFERSKIPGGMLRWGIPDYRLPGHILDQEIEKIRRMGVTIETRVSPGKDFVKECLREFKVIFLALGSQKDRTMGIPGENLPGVQSGLDFLRRVKEKGSLDLGQQVTVVGGGNTAIDVVRTALRLGSKPFLLYRRTRSEMPAVTEEVEEALVEGARIEFLVSPISISKINGEKGLRVECIKNRLGNMGEDGRRNPVPIQGSNFFIETDNVFTAVGETIEPDGVLDSLEWTEAGIAVDGWGRTKTPGIFAGGDVTAGPRTVSHAIGSGKKAALAMDAFLRGRDSEKIKPFLLGKKGSFSMAQTLNPPSSNHRNDQVVRFEDLNDAYFEHRSRKKNSQSATSERIKSFDEVNLGFTKKMTIEEAERCFRCGECSSCENCYTFCPDSAVSWNDQQAIFEIDYEFCKGCGICVHECCSHCIETVPEEKW
jgi:NADPH-dependent glutamate synthase beta subunit-like oxidoreductase/Pyruvate/2-oxoacid:ferredoxin oxidoreductase delta subunit